MFGSNDSVREKTQIFDALNRSMAIIEFDLDGNIITANENFLQTMGYTLDEIVGKHHRIFMPPEIFDETEYKAFWAELRSGQFVSGAMPRRKKNGDMIWLEASYNPILNRHGKPKKVVKFASDITERRVERAMWQSVFRAIEKSQATIEFELDGTIISANQMFLDVMGYKLEEIQGKHHSIFIEPEYRNSQEYKDFWKTLNAGEYNSGEFKRIGKGGREVWISASYNPVLDPVGRPFKVVKFATDITAQTKLLLDLKRIIDTNFREIDGNLGELNSTADQSVSMSEETSNTVHTVSASAEQMAASIAEISQSMSQSRSETERAFAETVTANESTQRMAQVVDAMGNIVEVIRNIAGQINLLALNATIESARAGEAGKGFAVVANEVKNLANQAAKATEDISEEISGIQAISGEVVGALETIQRAVETVRDGVTSISSAVEEQSAVTSGVTENMRMMASSVEGLTSNLENIRVSTSRVAESVKKTQEAASVLAK
ncbi:PAS domain-containing methyl-accepting chemotaxis protein [Thalassospira sp.]|uniref:methyl-accepting chemotaxis protein n=1 Tax=Thalassospira sp. TaxID=1912094 RepID=UPI000C5E4AD8|nr:PAS domain-containing methyl-accepting chemotaxis protein [Thalassospira sp.]MBC04731.1 chemotaxis protein [Thalassospira sp.]|tara:strand:- start:12578 stop:14056 length:1479 start_codon:yes stop_codon:yes gene_type:complete